MISEDAILRDIENGCVSVLKTEDKIIATGCFVENHITRVYVLPEYQKKGYGTFVMKSMEAEIAKTHNKAYLDASLPAAALYENLGFCTVRHEKYPVGNGIVLVYDVMEKKLWKEMSMNTVYEYKKAAIEDIDELVRTRVVVLRAANNLSDEEDMQQVEKESYEYYKRALGTGEHIAYLVFDDEKLIGAGGVSFYHVMPTYHNPSGKKAYIMNMYTSPEYRRKGIAYQTLDLLVKEARAQGVSQIALEATDMGRPLYEKYGFTAMKNEMELA